MAPPPLPRRPFVRAPIARVGFVACVAVTLVVALAGCGSAGAPATPHADARAAVVASTAVPPVPTATATAPVTPTPEPTPARPVVVLDPGHGGSEIGAAANGILEKDSNLDMALRTEAYLQAAGVDVVLTRRTDARASGPDAPATGYAATRADLLARVRIANAAHAAVFVSIHSNGNPDLSQRGIEVWYDSRRTFGKQNLALAQTLLDSTLQALAAYGAPAADRGVKDASCWQEYHGHCVGLYVLSPARAADALRTDARPGALATEPPAPSPDASPTATRRPRIPKEATDMPGALVELLFITNPEDAALLRTSAARDALAHGLANGILQYLHASAGG